MSGMVSLNLKSRAIFRSSRVYPVAESAWDVMLIAWTPVTGLFNSLMMTLALVLNIFVQALCSAIALSALSVLGNFVNNDSIDTARMWRLTEAHNPDRMDKANWMSLARRVCAKDGSLVLGNSQLSIIKEIESYMGTLDLLNTGITVPNVGFILTMLCIFIFFVYMAKELTDCITFFEALLAIPKDRKTSISKSGDTLKLTSISIVRFTFLVLILITRVCIAIILLYSGGQWLANTSALADLLLNCAALVFILEMDELLFATLVPPFAKDIMTRLDGLPLPKEREVCGASWRPPFVLIGCFIYLVLFANRVVSPMQDRMERVAKEMCNHNTNLDFVIDVNAEIGYAVVAVTTDKLDEKNLWNGSLKKLVTGDFVNEGINERYRHDWSDRQRLSEFAPQTKYNASATIVLGEQRWWTELDRGASDVLQQTECKDLLGESLLWTDRYLLALRFQSNKSNAKSCVEFAEFCASREAIGSIVRGMCSKTCLCHTHLAPLFSRRGCTEICLANLNKELVYSGYPDIIPLPIADCTDKDAEFFNQIGPTNDAFFVRRPLNTSFVPMEEYFGAVEDHFGFQPGSIPKQLFKEHGCDALIYGTGLGSSNAEGWLQNEAQVKDALCGRIANTNIPQPALGYQTLRWVCPVSCGCSINRDEQCPKVCLDGANSSALDACDRPCIDEMMIVSEMQRSRNTECANYKRRMQQLQDTRSNPAECERIRIILGRAIDRGGCCTNAPRVKAPGSGSGSGYGNGSSSGSGSGSGPGSGSGSGSGPGSGSGSGSGPT